MGIKSFFFLEVVWASFSTWSTPIFASDKYEKILWNFVLKIKTYILFLILNFLKLGFSFQCWKFCTSIMRGYTSCSSRLSDDWEFSPCVGFVALSKNQSHLTLPAHSKLKLLSSQFNTLDANAIYAGPSLITFPQKCRVCPG